MHAGEITFMKTRTKLRESYFLQHCGHVAVVSHVLASFAEPSRPGHLLRLPTISAMIVGAVADALQTDSGQSVP
jgi:hypothetical protein